MSNVLLQTSYTSSTLRSGFVISNLTQCVEELVLNSIDAHATNVTVFLDISTMTLEVSDNGVGISKVDLETVGKKYYTSKCSNIEHLEKNLGQYGYRGEALSSIADLSAKLIVTSCFKGRTFFKIVTNYGKIHHSVSESNAESNFGHGTTVIAKSLFSELAVRKKSLVFEAEIQLIKKRLLNVFVIHWNVSLEFNEIKLGNILKIQKTTNVTSRFQQIFAQCLVDHLSVTQADLKLEIYFSSTTLSSNSIRLVYVNKRLVEETRIHDLMKEQMKCLTTVQCNASMQVKPYHGYVVLIECPYSWYDVGLEPNKTKIEFSNWEKLLSTLRMLLKKKIANIEKTTYVKTNASYNSEAKQLLSETGIDSFICAADTVCLFGKKAVRMSNSLVSRITNTAVTKSVPTQCEVQIDSTTSSGNDIQKTASILPVGWIEKYDVKQGKVYVNITTGCTSSQKPDHEVAAERKRERNVAMKEDDILASWKFLPKKRLLKATIKNTDSVCSIAKRKINDDLPKVFFSDNEQKIPSLDRPLANTCCKISKSHLQNIKVIGQVSNEFIICVIHDLELQHSFIAIFDQHAVHERIRLEQFIKDIQCDEPKSWGIKSKKLQNFLKVRVSTKQLQVMGNNEEWFNKAGLYYQLPLNHAPNSISISAVPTIFAENENLKRYVQQLIESRTQALLNKQVSSCIPPPIFNILCLRACHGAIRFGDSLSVDQCSNLIKDLAQCQLPFQCAHGRPSLFPLIELNNAHSCPEPAPCNFARLKKMMTSSRSIG